MPVDISRSALDGYHDEVVAALREIGDPRFGAAVAMDRGSSLEHLSLSCDRRRPDR